MFPDRYFAKRYYAGRYFAPVTVAIINSWRKIIRLTLSVKRVMQNEVKR